MGRSQGHQNRKFNVKEREGVEGSFGEYREISAGCRKGKSHCTSTWYTNSIMNNPILF